MRKNFLVWTIIMIFCLSLGNLGFYASAVQAANTQTFAQELAKIYPFVDDADKIAVDEARTRLSNLSEQQWDTVLGIGTSNTMLTPQVINKFGDQATARAALVDFAKGLGKVYYSSSEAELTNNLDNFKAEFRESFWTLFGTDITFNDFYNFLVAAREKMPAVINGSITTLAFGSDAEVVAVIPDITKEAMDQVMADSSYSEFDNKFIENGWTTNKLVDQQKKLADIIDPGHNAELGMIKALVRSETKLSTSINQPVTVSVGQEVPHALTIFGKSATNIVEWKSSNSQIVSVTENPATDNYVITAIAPGTVIITAFRDVDANQAANDGDWLFKYEVTVSGVQNSNANLAELSSSSGRLFPAFDPDRSNYTVLLPSDYSGAVPVISAVPANALATVNITQATAVTGSETQRTAIVSVVTQNQTNQKTYRITFVKKTEVANIKTDGTATNVPVSESSQNFEVPAIAPADINNVSLSFNVPIDAENPTVSFQTQTSGGNVSALLPEVEVTAVRQIGGVQKSISLSIPSGTTVTAPAGSNWDGTIALPSVISLPSATVPGTAAVVLELGAGNVELQFDKALRLLLPDQAGKAAAYIRNGILTTISRVLSADTQVVADSSLGTGEDGKINAAADLAIWTKHFTEFLAYTPTPSGGGGGGGGGAAVISSNSIGQNGGTVTALGVSVLIPANALSSDIKVTIEKVNKTGLPVPVNSELISEVFDISKDMAGKFDKPVTISIAFDKNKADSSKQDLSVCYLDTSSNQWVKLDNLKLDFSKNVASGDVDHFTKFAVIATLKAAVQEPVLSDIQGHWAEQYIKSLVQSGVMTGYPDGSFKPDNKINRAEFATILVNAYKLTPKNDIVFDDIRGHWAQEYISTVASYGIVKGYGANRFGPEDLITREQMAVMIVNAAKLKQSKLAGNFADQAQISPWALESVYIAASEGIISGYPDHTFKAKGQAARAEAATVIFKTLQLKQ